MRKVSIIALMLCLMTGCALISKFKEMPTKKKALWFMRTYNAEYFDVMKQAQYYSIMPEEAKKVLRWRHKLLVQIYPLIKKYLAKIEAGVEPTVEEENELTDLMNRLMTVDPADVEENAPPEPKVDQETVPDASTQGETTTSYPAVRRGDLFFIGA